MAVPLIPLLALGIGVLSSASKSKKDEDYQKQQEAFNEEERKRSYRERWRQSLMRAVKGENLLGISESGTAPTRPDTSVEDMLGAGASIVGNIAGSNYGAETAGAYGKTNPNISGVGTINTRQIGRSGALTRGGGIR